MSIWGHARNFNLHSSSWAGYRIPAYTTTLSHTGRFLATEDEEDSAVALHNVCLCGAKCINKCWTQPGWRLWEKQISQPTVEVKRATKEQEKSSKVESTYWRLFTSQVYLGSFFTILLFCTKQATPPDTCTGAPLTHIGIRGPSQAVPSSTHSQIFTPTCTYQANVYNHWSDRHLAMSPDPAQKLEKGLVTLAKIPVCAVAAVFVWSRGIMHVRPLPITTFDLDTWR